MITLLENDWVGGLVIKDSPFPLYFGHLLLSDENTQLHFNYTDLLIVMEGGMPCSFDK